MGGGETEPGYCDIKNKATEMSLYLDIAESKVGQNMQLEFSAAGAKADLDGRFWSDEMIGRFAQATNFKIGPLVEVFKAKGPVTAKTGEIVTTLPEKGRVAAAAAFADACKLD